jgi:hypothetical protein
LDSATKTSAKWQSGSLPQGFHVDCIPRSRTYITFSGTVGRTRDAFATELHRYTWGGKQHFANVREITIPTELEPLVYPPRGLDDFGKNPLCGSSRISPMKSFLTQSHGGVEPLVWPKAPSPIQSRRLEGSHFGYGADRGAGTRK